MDTAETLTTLTTTTKPPATAALPVGHRLANFEFESVVARGNAGLVYRALDQALGRPVAIKEYLPPTLARRSAGAEVEPNGDEAAGAFEFGLQAFIEEAKTLARCDHPSLLRVLQLVESNGTAYRVMPWYTSRMRLDVRRTTGGPLPESALRALLDDLLGALEAYHRVGGVHGAVSASNVLVLEGDRPLLMGPQTLVRPTRGGSGDSQPRSPRPALSASDRGAAPDARLKDTSADFHALAALARFCITGMPAAATELTLSEPLAATVERLFFTHPSVHYSADLLGALDVALSPDVARRPQSAAQFRALLAQASPSRQTSEAFSVDAATDDVIQRVIESIPEPVVRMPRARTHAADPHTISAMRTGPVDPNSFSFGAEPLMRRRSHRRKHRALWTVFGVIAVAVIGLGAWEFQAPLLRLVEAGTQPAAAPSTVARAPLPVSPTSADTPLPSTRLAAPAAPLTVAAPAPTTEAATRVVPAVVPPVAPPIAQRVATAPPSTTETAAPKSPTVASVVTPVTIAETSRTAAAAPAPSTTAKLSTALPVTALSKQRAVASQALPDSSTPRLQCGARTDFSLYRCMQQQCDSAKFQQHPQCLRLRATDRVD